MAGQAVRAAGYGFTAVVLGALLAARGFSSLQAGRGAYGADRRERRWPVSWSEGSADRMGRRRSYALFFAGVAVAGVVVAAGGRCGCCCWSR